jgi:2-phosphosulfolactate phosphatase
VTPAALDVCFTPREIRPVEVAIVLDVLRATSTIVEALAVGYSRVICCSSIAAARHLRAPGRVLAGERDCVRVPDFHLGNSPAAVAAAGRSGKELVLATTNGSPAIVAASAAARRVLIGSLLNLRALLDVIPADGAVTIVCSGTDGRPALEDVYAAGRLVAGMSGDRSDAARVAAGVASVYQTALEPLAESENGARLRASGQAPDIAWCARESVLRVVPEVHCAGEGLAVVGRSPAQDAPPRSRPPAAARPGALSCKGDDHHACLAEVTEVGGHNRHPPGDAAAAPAREQAIGPA